MVSEGNRALMFYLVQRSDCNLFKLAEDIDPAYAETFTEVRKVGVEAVCYACHVSPSNIKVTRPIPIVC